MSNLIANLKRDIGNKYRALFANPFQSLGLKWIEVKKWRSLPTTSVHEASVLNHKLYFRDGNEVLHGLHEIFIDKVYQLSLPAAPFIIDCGAHIGLSVIYLKQQHPGARILAFEPDKTNFSLLQKNISSFGLTNIDLRNEAVWKENTTLRFAQEGSMSSKIETNGDAASNNSQVTATRLLDVMTRKVDFLKLDIEGAEYEVLKDISSKLGLIENMFIEYHGLFSQNKELNEILQMVTGSGFSYYIKEAANVYHSPFQRTETHHPYDVQLNIFCFRKL